MGQQLTSSLHITTIGTLEPKDMVVLSRAFDGMEPVMSKEGWKVISEEKFCSFLTTTVPTVGPFSHIVYEVFRTPKSNGIKFQDFCLAVQSLTYFGRDDVNEESIASRIFKHFEKKGTGYMTVNGVLKMGKLIDNQKGFDKKKAMVMITNGGAAVPSKGFTREEFIKFFLVCVPTEHSFGTETVRAAKLSRVYNTMPFIRDEIQKREEVRQSVLTSPRHDTVTEKMDEVFHGGASVDLEGLEAMLEIDSVLPGNFARVAMLVFGSDGGMSLSQYQDLKTAVTNDTFGKRLFDFYDGDHDGVLALSECLKVGSELGLPEWKNTVKSWRNIASECGILYGKKGVTVEWFVMNMFLL